MVYRHGSEIGSAWFWDMNKGIMVDDMGKVYKTVDGGISWTFKGNPVNTGLTSMVFKDSLTGFAVGYYGVIISTADGGETWTVENSPVTGSLVRVRIFDDYAYAVGFDGTMVRSSAITGINENLFHGLLEVYPNPAADMLQISVKDKSIAKFSLLIYDMNGRAVKSASAENSTMNVDVSALPCGTYVAEVNAGDKKLRKKLLICR
jgi:hypothetical protein